MRDKKIIYFLLGQAALVMALAFFIPIICALADRQFELARSFFMQQNIAAMLCSTFFCYGRGHRRRIEVADSAIAMICIWFVMSIIGALPFVIGGILNPVDAFLETVSDLTAAGVGFLPSSTPYEFKLWQAALMWQGSLMFLVVLVTLLPEVSGCFGMELSLSQGQIFSPMLGQMLISARRIANIYSILTLLSMLMFKIAGLDWRDAVIMSMRCLSTGGGEFSGVGNVYVEYVAAFSMLLACGNFLLYFRLIHTLTPHFNTPPQEFKRNLIANIKTFYSNSEVQFMSAVIVVGTLLIAFTIFDKNYITDGNTGFRMALFHVVSFASTTGMTLRDISNAPDFDRFFLFLLVAMGGCMGSVTGGLKVIRVLILFKIAAVDIHKTIHPRMMPSITVNGSVVPIRVVGRILSYFFLCVLTLFVCSVILSLSGQTFSTSVVMTLACLTNVGIMPGLCDSSTFMQLPIIMKLFCALIFVVGRMEIFAFLIVLSSVKFRQEKTHWH